MAEMKVFVINLDEQEKDTGCAWFTLPCNIEALKQSIGLPPDSDRYLISDYDFPFEILQDTDLDLLNNVCLAISESEIPPEDIPEIPDRRSRWCSPPPGPERPSAPRPPG